MHSQVYIVILADILFNTLQHKYPYALRITYSKPIAMKPFYAVSFILFFALTFYSCTSPGASKQEKQTELEAFESMMSIHDDVMPKMGEINRLSRQLKQSFERMDTTDRELMGKIDNTLRALETADQGMMAWMNMNAGGVLEKMQAEKGHEEIMAYIKSEEAMIKTVAEQMNTSIAQGKALVEQMTAKE